MLSTLGNSQSLLVKDSGSYLPTASPPGGTNIFSWPVAAMGEGLAESQNRKSTIHGRRLQDDRRLGPLVKVQRPSDVNLVSSL